MSYRSWILPALIIIVWSVSSATGLLNTILIPSPWSIVTSGFTPKNLQGISMDILRTSARLGLGFILGSNIGLLIGLAMGCSRRVYQSLEFMVDFFRSIPVAALFPLFLVLLGIGNLSKIAIIAWSTSLIVLINTMYGVRSCSPVRLQFARSLRATRMQVLRTIIIPEAMPSIFAGFRTGISIALIVVILTEMFFGSSSGLGHRIYNSALLYKTPQMYFCVILTGLLGYGLNQGFVICEKKLLRWHFLRTDSENA